MRFLAYATNVIRGVCGPAAVMLALSVPTPVQAQTPTPQATATTAPADKAGIGEKYWIEFSYTWWQPNLVGDVTSDRLGLIGSRVDLTTDLALESSQFSDFRFVLHPAKKHRIRVQYTPIRFEGSGTLTRDITFAGQVFPVSLPVDSFLTWKVLRVGYEWDFFYRPRGFVGVIVEGGLVQLDAGIDSIVGSAQAEGQSPLVALGLAGRFYPIRHLAINVEGTGLQVGDVDAENMLKTFAFDLSATYNFTRNFGASAGWRRTNTSLSVSGDSGKLDFKGLWIGGVVRY